MSNKCPKSPLVQVEGQKVGSTFAALGSGIDLQQHHGKLNIVQQCSAAWRTQDYVRNLVTPTPSPEVKPVQVSSDSATHSTAPETPQRSASDAEDKSDTNVTSIFETDGESIGSFFEMTEVLVQKDVEITAVRKQANDAQRQLQEKDAQYKALVAAYNIQLDQRHADKEKVDDAFQRYTDIAKRCHKLEKSIRAHNGVKNRAVAKLKHEQRTKVSEMESNHRQELCNKVVELETIVKLKDDTIKQAEAATKDALEKIRKVVTAAETNRNVWQEEKDATAQKAWQMNANYEDCLQTMKDEVMRLTSTTRRMERENAAMWDALHKNSADLSVQDVILESVAMRKELARMRQKNTILIEKEENILDAMQQERDHWEKQHQKEKVAQVQARKLEIELSDRKQMLAHRDERIRDLGTELMMVTAGHGNEHSRFGALERAIVDVDDLRTLVKTLQEEKAEIQSKANKFDDDALELAMEIGDKEAKLYSLGKHYDALRYAHEVSEQELEYLRNAVREGGGSLSPEERASLVTHLRDLTAKVQMMTTEAAVMMEELDHLRKHKQSTETEAQHAVDQAKAQANYFYNAFYDFAVNKVEKLQQELDEKNGKLPSKTQGRQERNPVVADRAILRTACEGGTMRDISSSRIPPEYHEPGFRAGRIAATMDALRVLRPMGWESVEALEKVWLQPLYKPFTEDDAAAYLDAEEQHILQQAVAFKHGDVGKLHVPESEQARSQARATEAPRAPPYEPRFAKYGNMSRERYNALEPDNKLDYIRMFLPGGQL
ncbi:hypothetical protein EJ07DRAFT_108574 [Lizonia empirigonia]|nr:hypothetical protein EJ07DRAFT_108574 [Lizonia empirigonia]